MIIQFTYKQVADWLTSIFKRKSLWHLYRYPLDGVDLLLNLVRNEFQLKKTPPFKAKGKSCSVILLSHNRPQNMDYIVRNALSLPFATSVIVSNSNRKIKIAGWIKQNDPRLHLIDETELTQPGHRFVLADRQKEEFFLAIDDDIFLSPRQWFLFYEALAAYKEVPHGLIGNFYNAGTTFSNGSPFHHVERQDCEVDVLIGAYAFTRRHLEELFSLAPSVGQPNLSLVRNGEDVMLSMVGTGNPIIHDLGRLFTCSTSAKEGVALSKDEDEFWDVREKLLLKCRSTQKKKM